MTRGLNQTTVSVKAAVATGLCTIVVALIGAWQVAAQTTPNQPDYSKDRNLILSELTQLQRQNNRLEGELVTLEIQRAEDHTILVQLSKK